MHMCSLQMKESEKVVKQAKADAKKAESAIQQAKSEIDNYKERNRYSMAVQWLIVPTPLEGGGTIYSTGFFLFSQFWPIDIFIVES